MRDAAEALHDLGLHIGLDTLAFDHEGDCGIVIDEESEVFFHGTPDSDTMRIWGVVGDLYPRGDLLAQHLLALNFDDEQTGSATFAVDPSTGEILLTLQIAVGSISKDDFLAIIEDFVERVEYWFNYLPRMALESDSMDDVAADAVLIRG